MWVVCVLVKNVKIKKKINWSKDKRTVMTSYEFFAPLSVQNTWCFLKQ